MSKRKYPADMKRGDLIYIYWLDIVGDQTGDDADLAKCGTSGHFDRFCMSNGRRCLKTYITEHFEDEETGKDIYPLSVIERVKVLMKKEDNEWKKDSASSPSQAGDTTSPGRSPTGCGGSNRFLRPSTRVKRKDDSCL